MNQSPYRQTFDLTECNFVNFIKPGLYEIINLINKKRYIGQSKNVLERLGKHVATLQFGSHDCLMLQKDWTHEKRAGNIENAFLIKIICLGSEFLDEKTRKTREVEYLSTFDAALVYNRIQIPKTKTEKPKFTEILEDKNFKNYRRIVVIKEQEFESINAASRHLNAGETTIRRWINSANKTDCFVKRVEKHGYSVCLVDGVEYPSIKSLVDAGVARSEQFAKRRLANPHFENWQYVTTKKKYFSPKTIKHAKKPCIVDGKRYPSVNSLVTAGLVKRRYMAENRLSNPSFPNWQYT